MNAELIYQATQALKKEFKYSNLEDLASQLNIKLYYRNNFDKLLGLYAIIENQACIFLNARLDFYFTKMVLAHEIGHDRLHKDFAKNSVIGEYSLFDTKNSMEYEANAFASHLLINTSEICDYLNNGMSVKSISSELGVDYNLTLIKLIEMKKLGYNIDLSRLPEFPKGNFLKKINF